MLRQESLEEISDGKKYGINDMVRADTLGCRGCSKCCETMTDTIVLAPYDIYMLNTVTGKNFNELMQKYIEIGLQDGVALPNLKNSGSGCPFLTAEKRCSVHDGRPDICRLFPLGRLYENDSFSYILQTGECDRNVSKVKVRKWLGINDYDRYSAYILRWHGIVVGMRKMAVLSAGSAGVNAADKTTGNAAGNAAGNAVVNAADYAAGNAADSSANSARTAGRFRALTIKLLELFYQTPFSADGDFYEEFGQRAERFEKWLLTE